MSGSGDSDGAEVVPSRNLPNPADPRVPKIVEACLRGKSWAEISHELKIPPRTLYQLRDDYDIEAIVSQLNRDAIAALAIGHTRLVAKARTVLLKLLDSKDERIRLGAALKLYPEPTAPGERRRARRLKALADGELSERAVAALGRRQRR